jgi:hypothetical protein
MTRSFIVALALLARANAFSPISHGASSRHSMELSATDNRRSFLQASGVTLASILTLAQPALAEQIPETRQGIEVNSFNGLAFNYRGGDFGGSDASELNEPSVPYADFIQRLKEGKVEFVEFMAPDGDAAYATFKATEGGSKSAPIRIGEGYPVEQHDGYSSPAFAIRAVKNAGVSYKFTVPALTKYKMN